MATKKPMKFKGGGKIKGYYQGEVVTGDDTAPYGEEGMPNVYARNGAIDRDTIARNNEQLRGREDAVAKRMREMQPGSDFVIDTDAGVRKALRGETSSLEDQGYGFKQLPPSVAKARAKAAKAVGNQTTPSAGSSENQPAVDNSIPPASTSSYKAPVTEEKSAIRKNFPGMASIYDYYASPSSMQGVKDNLANSAAALTPLTGGASKVATEFALGNRGMKAAQVAQGEGKLSAAGQRLKNMEEVRNVAMPGRREAVMNPNAWAGGPKTMDKIAQVEGKAAQAEAKAAQSAAKKKAVQAKKDAKDPVMNARPGTDKAKPGDYAYESDVALSPMFGFKKGGAVKKFAKGGSVSSASSRGDGIAIRGKTKGTISKMCGGGMYKGKK